jgi:hypothetical protein
MIHNALLAGVLKGKVVDEKGLALPFATIYLEGTTIGVNANGNGDYELPVSPGLYKVICQYVGFTQSTYNLSVTGTETLTHNFVLKEQSLEMKEVVRSSIDPAYEIIRSAISRRAFHLDQVRSFQTDIYLKGGMKSRKMPKKFMGQKVTDETDLVDSVGRGVLFLTEEDASYYSQGSKEKTLIHSVHQSGNPSGLGFSRFPSVITFYENNVNLMGRESRGFISPISDNALSYYKYKLLGEFKEQGHTIYKIQVTPKRAYEPCFSGTIYIADEEWAIHSLNMTLAKQSGMDMFDTLKVDQLFLPLQKDTWVIKSQVIYFTVNMLGFDITASVLTVYNNQKINEPIPDSVFEGKIISAYDKTANKKDTSYWKENRPIPLEKDEQRDFVAKDSLNKRLQDPVYIDSMLKKQNKLKPMSWLMGGFNYTGKGRKNVFSTNSLLLGINTDNIINYNIVEGFNLAPKLTWQHFVDTGKRLYTELAARYGFSNTHFNAIGRVYYMQQDRTFLNRSWVYGFEGGKYVFQYSAANPVLPWFNTYAALLYRVNDLKLYERWDATAYVARNYGTGLNWYLKASYQQRMYLNNSTNYSFFEGDVGDFKSNTPPYLLQQATDWKQNDAAIITANISYKPGYTYTQYPDYKVANGSSWPRFTLQYTKGLPGIINSVSDFDKWRFSVQDEVRLRLLGVLKYNFATGGFLNSNYVAAPDLMHLYGNRGIGYASLYLESFQFAQFYEFSNKDSWYGEAHVEYHLRGLLSNKVPLLRQARWYLLFGGNAFYVNDSRYYTEAFVGIDNIGYKLARYVRLDFVQSWDSHFGRNSGIRFGLTLPGMSATKTYAMHGEW